MLSYLVHAFPRVNAIKQFYPNEYSIAKIFYQIRIEVSDQLFTQFSVSEEADEDIDMMEAIEIITGTDW